MVGGIHNPDYGLERHGLGHVGRVFWSCVPPVLYEQAIRGRTGMIAFRGPLVVRTGQYTGRSPDDRFIVEEESSRGNIWWGENNRPFSEEKFDDIFARLQAYLQGKDVYVQDGYAGADPEYRISVRVIAEDPWHSLFARIIFIRMKDDEGLRSFVPQFTVINAPGFHADPARDGTNSEAFILINLAKRLILIGGTSYAGEIKKSIFSVLNYLLPERGVLPMHCSANKGDRGDTTLFFGLSGTGKTTLSVDPERHLIGDDEHGWSDNGVFNFEGGCYAKVINLSQEAEPQIFECTRKFGTILENVHINARTRDIDLADASITENTRAAYPLASIANHEPSGRGDHPEAIIFLTCDAFGVLPPISRLTPDQAMYHFISGYTAKVAGTERGIKEPKATFSACFGAAFMVRNPSVYASLLGDNIKRHGVDCWLVNTGWIGGPYGTGERIPIGYTRALIRHAIEGDLKDGPMRNDPFFGLAHPTGCDGVPGDILDPRDCWGDKEAYDAKAGHLARLFRENFKAFEDDVDAVVLKGGPVG